MDREITQSLADIRQQFEVAKLHRVQEQASDEHDHSINSERFCLFRAELAASSSRSLLC